MVTAIAGNSERLGAENVLGAEFWAYLRHRGIAQAHLARRCGVDRSTLHRAMTTGRRTDQQTALLREAMQHAEIPRELVAIWERRDADVTE